MGPPTAESLGREERKGNWSGWGSGMKQGQIHGNKEREKRRE